MDDKKQKSPIEVLDELSESGDLQILVRSGLISINIVQWRKIFHAYQFRLKSGAKSSQAITDVSDMFSVSERLVYRINERFK